jgi:rare lipoprotein A (peptidoglycan hydrolase)
MSALLLLSTLVAFQLTAGTASALTPPLPAATNPVEELDAATREVVELESRIQETRAERIALDSRLAVLDERIDAQQAVLEGARQRLETARDAYGLRIVAIYKHGHSDPLALLLGSASIQEFLSRSSWLGRIAVQDKELWTYMARCTSEEHYEASVLEDLRAQDARLRELNQVRERTLRSDLAKQERLVEELTAEAAAYLSARQAQGLASRREWQASSVPLSATIGRVPATVEPHVDRTYLVSEGQPTRYRLSGPSYTAVCSWYGPGFHGRTTASGQVFNENDFTCASRTLPFGTRLALSRGDRHIVVFVNDRGPFIAGRDLDLSKAAAQALGFSGVEPVTVETVVPVR